MKTPLSIVLKDKGVIVYSASSNESVYDCVKQMQNANIGALLIIDGDKLVGMFTERHLRNIVIPDHIDTVNTPVSQVMSTKILTVYPDTTVEEAMGIMTKRRYRHLPMVNKTEKEVIGVISIGDLTHWLLKSQQNDIDHLVGYIGSS